MSELIEGNELTQEMLEADAAAEASGLGAIYQPMLEAKRAKAAKATAKTGHKKRPDRRFKIYAVDGAGVASPNSAKSSPSGDCWDAQQIDYEEFHRIIQVERPYTVHVNGDFQWAPNANKDQLFDQIFQDRARTPQNLLRLYRFMCLKHAGGFPSLEGTPLCDLVVKILVRDGLIEEPVLTMVCKFGGELSEDQ